MLKHLTKKLALPVDTLTGLCILGWFVAVFCLLKIGGRIDVLDWGVVALPLAIWIIWLIGQAVRRKITIKTKRNYENNTN